MLAPAIQIDDINVFIPDPANYDTTIKNRWRADTRAVQVSAEDKPRRAGLVPIDPYFPPRRLGRGERFEIKRFTLSNYGTDFNGKEGPIWTNENADSWARSATFKNATYLIRFELAYYENPIKSGDYPWKCVKEYNNRVYMRNKNLLIKKQLEQ